MKSSKPHRTGVGSKKKNEKKKSRKKRRLLDYSRMDSYLASKKQQMAEIQHVSRMMVNHQQQHHDCKLDSELELMSSADILEVGRPPPPNYIYNRNVRRNVNSVRQICRAYNVEIPSMMMDSNDDCNDNNNNKKTFSYTITPLHFNNDDSTTDTTSNSIHPFDFIDIDNDDDYHHKNRRRMRKRMMRKSNKKDNKQQHTKKKQKKKTMHSTKKKKKKKKNNKKQRNNIKKRQMIVVKDERIKVTKKGFYIRKFASSMETDNNEEEEEKQHEMKEEEKEEEYTQGLMNNDHIIECDFIGRGSNSNVWKCWSVEQQCFIAVKQCSVSETNKVNQMLREISVLYQIHHNHNNNNNNNNNNNITYFSSNKNNNHRINHIIGLYNAVIKNNICYLSLEYANGGSLSKYKPISNIKILSLIIKQVTQALYILETIGITHCDLKPDNLLCFVDQGLVKLADFGLSFVDDHQRRQRFMMIMDSEENKNKLITKEDDNDNDHPRSAELPSIIDFGGTLAYLSPERLNGDIETGMKKLDIRCDVWSLGISMITLFNGEYPFSIANRTHLLTSLENNMPLDSLLKCNDQSNNNKSFQCMSDFIGYCTKMSLNERWMPNQLLLHPFIINSKTTKKKKRKHQKHLQHISPSLRSRTMNIKNKDDYIDNDNNNNHNHEFQMLSEWMIKSMRKRRKKQLNNEERSKKKTNTSLPLLSATLKKRTVHKTTSSSRNGTKIIKRLSELSAENLISKQVLRENIAAVCQNNDGYC